MAADNLSSAIGKGREYCALTCRETACCAIMGESPKAAVEVIVANPYLVTTTALRGVACQESFDACKQLIEGKGFADIVVTATMEALDNILRATAGGEKEYLDTLVEFAHQLHHIEPIHLGHHNVGDNQLGVIALEAIEALDTVFGCRYVVASAL